MAFCNNQTGRKIKQFLDKVEQIDEKVIDEVTDITGKIKSYESNPTVQFVVSLIPNGSTYEAAFNSAIDKIVPALQKLGSFAEKLESWLEGKSELEKNGNLLKLAATTVAEHDNNQHNESLYDTAVQTHIEGLK